MLLTMCSHYLSMFHRYVLTIPFWIGLCVITCDAQTFWQMVHEDEEDDAESVVEKRRREIVLPSGKSEVTSVNDKKQNPYMLSERGWRKNITATIFWVGEKACRANPVHNKSSSWDMRWVQTFGGVDHPYKRVGFHPKGFQPRANPFYVALPYNDIGSKTHQHKAEASKVIWWYSQRYQNKYLSVCKGKWIAIKHGDKTCYAQWQDCGPFLTNDWEYVFKGRRPKTTKNGSAGIDLSPAVRDYLRLKSGEKVAWKFVEELEIELGPWSKWLENASLLTNNP